MRMWIKPSNQETSIVGFRMVGDSIEVNAKHASVGRCLMKSDSLCTNLDAISLESSAYEVVIVQDLFGSLIPPLYLNPTCWLE